VTVCLLDSGPDPGEHRPAESPLLDLPNTFLSISPLKVKPANPFYIMDRPQSKQLLLIADAAISLG